MASSVDLFVLWANRWGLLVGGMKSCDPTTSVPKHFHHMDGVQDFAEAKEVTGSSRSI